MMKYPLIAFTGYAGAGKSTAADAIRDSHSRLSFATPLRLMLKAFGLTDEQLTTGKQEPIDWLPDRTPRQLLQTLGTEWGRQMVDSDIWVKLARRQANTLLQRSDSGVVFDDCRFDNEAKMVHEMGGVVVRIIDHKTRPVSTHASEAGVNPLFIDFNISNHGTRSFPELVRDFVAR